MGPRCSATTGPQARIGLSTSSPRAGSPLQQTINAHSVSPWRSSGMKGSGGAIWNAKNPPSSRGAAEKWSRKKAITSGAASSSKKIGPPTI